MSSRSKAQVEQELSEARKNHAATQDLMKQHAGKGRVLAILEKSLGRFEGEIIRLESEQKGAR